MLTSVFYVDFYYTQADTFYVTCLLNSALLCPAVHKNSNTKLLGMQAHVNQFYKSSSLV